MAACEQVRQADLFDKSAQGSYEKQAGVDPATTNTPPQRYGICVDIDTYAYVHYACLYRRVTHMPDVLIVWWIMLVLVLLAYGLCL